MRVKKKNTFQFAIRKMKILLILEMEWIVPVFQVQRIVIYSQWKSFEDMERWVFLRIKISFSIALQTNLSVGVFQLPVWEVLNEKNKKLKIPPQNLKNGFSCWFIHFIQKVPNEFPSFLPIWINGNQISIDFTATQLNKTFIKNESVIRIKN